MWVGINAITHGHDLTTARRSPWYRRLFSRRGKPVNHFDSPMVGVVTGQSGVGHTVGYGGGITPQNEDRGSPFTAPGSFVRHARMMLRTDPKQFGAWQWVLQHLLGAAEEAIWLPGADSQLGRRVAAFHNENFGLGEFKGRGRMWKPLRSQLQTIYTWIPFGFTIHEELTYTAPDSGGAEKVWLRSYEPRSAALVESWVPNEDGTGWCAVNMRKPSGYGATYRLPIDNDPENPGRRTLHICADMEGGDPEGRLGATLRPNYGYDDLKRRAWEQLGIGVEKIGAGHQKARINYALAEQQGMSKSAINDAIALTRTVLQTLRSDSGADLLESDIVELVEHGGPFAAPGLVDVLNLMDTQTLSTSHMHGMVQGLGGNGGSYASARVHADSAKLLAANQGQHTAEAISDGTARWLTRVNFGANAPVPTLCFPGLKPNPMPDVAGHVVNAVAQGMPWTAEWCRAFYDMGALPVQGVDFDAMAAEANANRAAGAAAGPAGSAGPGRPAGSLGTPPPVSP